MFPGGTQFEYWYHTGAGAKREGVSSNMYLATRRGSRSACHAMARRYLGERSWKCASYTLWAGAVGPQGYPLPKGARASGGMSDLDHHQTTSSNKTITCPHSRAMLHPWLFWCLHSLCAWHHVRVVMQSGCPYRISRTKLHWKLQWNGHGTHRPRLLAKS